MGLFDGLFGGGKKKKFKATPLDDPFTAQLLSGIEASGEGERMRLARIYGTGEGTTESQRIGSYGSSLMSQLQGRGFRNSSSAIFGVPGATADRREQALADLGSQLFSQRLGAQQAGIGLALQNKGIDENSRNAFAQRQMNQSIASSNLLGNALGTGFTTAFNGSGNVGGGLLGGFLGF